MQWDLGLQGVALLIVLSLGFGLFAQLVFWSSANRWVWLVGSAAFFASGLFISEVWFGAATAQQLQPNVDGLSFDEVLLGFVVGVPIVLAARYLTWRRSHRPVAL